MVITDDAKRFVIDSKPMFIGKFFAVLFGILSLLFPLILIASLFLPPSEAQIDCDRGRGICDVARSSGAGRFKHEDSVRIDAIDRAEVTRNAYRRNESTSYTAVVRTKSGETIRMSDPGYHTTVTDGYRRAVDGLNRFLADSSQPSFSTHFVASDTDWTMLILFALLSPLMGWIMFSFWVTRHVEVDRVARTIRVVTARKLRGATDCTIAFDEVTELRASGYRWLRIELITREGSPQVLALLPKWASMRENARRILTTLAADLGRAPSVNDTTRRVWALG